MADTRFIRTSPIGLLNIELKKNAFTAFGFDVFSEDGETPFDMTTYTDARLSVRANGNETTPILELTADAEEITLLDGSVLLNFSAIKTNIQARPYNYDLYVTDGGNEIVFLTGVFKIIQDY